MNNLNKKVCGRIEKWLDAPIEGEFVYVFLDGIWLKRSWAGEVKNVSVMVAVGDDRGGYRHVLGVKEGSKEDKESWTAFMRSLKSRGLSGVELFISDKCLGLVERVVLLKTIRCTVKVVWVYRQSQWVALFSTDLTLTACQIITYYGARWKIEAFFKELKHDIGSAETQTRHPQAVTNHLDFCMMATSVAWIYADRIAKTPKRWHAVEGRNHFAFSDVRRSITQAAIEHNFSRLFTMPRKSVVINSFVAIMLRMAA